MLVLRFNLYLIISRKAIHEGEHLASRTLIQNMITKWYGEIVQRFWVRSPVESPILLRREIPMAWGTTTDSLTPEINPFQYAIEIKCLTLKDQTSYLIPDG